MYIDLKWSNPNSGPVKTNIYRSLTALDKANLGTPIVVLNNKETTYRDSGVVVGTTYNYVIEFELNGVKVSTRNFTAVAQFVRGPGNPSVVIGNQNYGYMDYVSIGRILNIWPQAGMTISGTADNAFGPAIKFSYNNKVYLCALLPANTVGSTMANVTPLLNNDAGVPVTIEGYNYLLRMGKVLGPSWDGTTKVTTITDFDEFYAKFVLPQLGTLYLKPGETLGKLNTMVGTNVIVGREVIANTIATRIGIGNPITWIAPTTATTASQYIPLILEMVE